jgi:hypothetical protein
VTPGGHHSGERQHRTKAGQSKLAGSGAAAAMIGRGAKGLHGGTMQNLSLSS